VDYSNNFFFLGDGLRADKCLDTITHPTTGETGYLAPFIRSKILNDGTFGISHTRVPTESRPGHVALIAGFYEDVSAVTKGWKENPVDFDSVFNQSRHTYSYGSPDILPMFSRGASDENRVDAIMYGHEFEDFTKSSIELDQFVFDKIDALFDQAETDPELNEKLRQDKIVFFLHLLGIDTAGHSNRPYSAEYYDNIKYIDTKIEQLTKRIDAFYDDGKTAYVFTADHGMSDWGSHGDGHPDNTRTPLVAWGAGVAKPIRDDLGDHDDYSKPWDLNSVKRNDVNQADVASLMSYLVGLNYPANSVGEIPLAFIEATDKVKAEAIYANSMSIVEQYFVKEKATSSQLHYVQYPAFAEFSAQDRSLKIQQLIKDKKYTEAIETAEELMKDALKGLRYLQTYNWLFLRSLVTLGYIGWIGYASLSFLHTFVVVDNDAKTKSSLNFFVPGASIMVLAGLLTFLTKQNSPFYYNFYAIFPVFFWEEIVRNWNTLTRGIKLLITRTHPTNPMVTAVGYVILTVAVMEAIVFGYFYRETFSLCFWAAAVWPFVQDFKTAANNKALAAAWTVVCLVLSVFTLLPANKIESLPQILAAGLIMVLSSGLAVARLSVLIQFSSFTRAVVGLQLGLIALATTVTRSAVLSLQARQGLPLGCQIVGWLTLVASVIVPFAHSWRPVPDYRFRMLTIYMAFAPTFIILTVSFEGLFYIAFFALLVIWLQLEYKFTESRRLASGASAATDKTEGKSHEVDLNEVRLALFFFYFAQIGFFGIGNIASISSFTLDSVRRLIPIFNPFSMGALLIFKILCPFVVLSATLGILNIRLGLIKSTLFGIVLGVSDILTLNFFYLVKDEGSWLEIGTGISHFSIASFLCMFMILLEYLSGVLTSGIELGSSNITNNESVKSPIEELVETKKEK
jgi:phosphatidylinositol glycan class N